MAEWNFVFYLSSNQYQYWLRSYFDLISVETEGDFKDIFSFHYIFFYITWCPKHDFQLGLYET